MITLDMMLRPLVADSDMASLARIEQAAYGGFAWRPQQIERWTHARGCQLAVATTDIGAGFGRDGQVIGYLAWTEYTRRFQLVRLVVDPELHRRGLGRRLASFLEDEARAYEAQRIDALVSELAVGAQLFLRSRGYRWVATLEARRPEDSDVYAMQLDLMEDAR